MLDREVLIAAAIRCELERVKEIIQGMKTNGVDINHQKYGRTALMEACSNGHKEVALELLEVDGIDVNIQSSGGWTALIFVCFKGHASRAAEG